MNSLEDQLKKAKTDNFNNKMFLDKDTKGEDVRGTRYAEEATED